MESHLLRPEIFTSFTSLLDDNVIHSVCRQIDPEPQSNLPTDDVPLIMARAKKFECSVQNFKSFFEEEFGQTMDNDDDDDCKSDDNSLSEKLTNNATYEQENANLAKEVAKLKEKLEEKSVLLENQTKEIARLTKSLEEAELSQARFNELEIQNQELVSQRDIDSNNILNLRYDRITSTLETYKIKQNFKKLRISIDPADDKDEFNLETFLDKLVRNPETFKKVREIMLKVTNGQLEDGNFKSDKCLLCDAENKPEYSSETYSLSEMNTQLGAQSICHQFQITSLQTQHSNLQLDKTKLAAHKDRLLKENEQLKQELKNRQVNSQHKTIVRDLRNELRELREKNFSLETQIFNLKRQDSSKLKREVDHVILRADHLKLTNDFRKLFAKNDKFKVKYKTIQEQYKTILGENEKLKSQNSNLRNELQIQKHQMKTLKFQYTKGSQGYEHRRSGIGSESRGNDSGNSS